MANREARYSPEEAVRRGSSIYEQTIRAIVEADNRGMYVAIDLDSGAWEMDPDEDSAGHRLLARLPDAQTYMTRIGYGYTRQFGAGRLKRAS